MSPPTQATDALDRFDELNVIAAVKESLEDEAAGRVFPALEALAQLAARHQLPVISSD